MRYSYLFSKILSAQLLLDHATFGYEGYSIAKVSIESPVVSSHTLDTLQRIL